MISVIIPTYNRARCITRSMESVLQQTYHDIELIIVDDGSTDNTEEIVRNFSDERIKYVKIKHSGAGYARNVGIALAKGEYIAFQDSDDIWENYKLEAQLDCLVKENADIVFCSFDRGFEGSEEKSRVPSDTDLKSKFITFEDLIPNNFCSTQTILFRKQCFVEDKFNEKLPRLQDWELMLRLVRKWKVFFDNRVFVHQFIQSDSISANQAILFESLWQIFAMLTDIFKEQSVSIHNIESELAKKDELIQSINHEFNQTNIDLQNILLSDSWKITKPMRTASGFIRDILLKSKYSATVLNKIIVLKQKVIDLPDNTIEKQIIEKKSINRHYYQKDYDFSNNTTDIKVLALYLPQFHEIKENNEWWGAGFTEWTNVKKGKARFNGHYQPRIPDKSIGYYDLSNVETLKKQVLLAKKHGIFGFAIYYYWFSGKRLLEKPMDILLEHQEIDFPFMAIWANENWTRTWDGKENQILIAQQYTPNDSRQFILDLQKYIEDKRYIRVNGKPVVGLYDPTKIPDVKNVLKTWRKTARNCGIGEILIWVCSGDLNTEIMSIEDDVDAEYEFPPHGKGYVNHYDLPDYGVAYDYGCLVESVRTFDITNKKIPFFRGSMMQWDNSARKKENYHCWVGFTPERFYIWNRINIKFLREKYGLENRFMFVNAWNEWGEGTYLEPDKKYGFSCINALSKAIFDKPFENNNEQFIQYLGAGDFNLQSNKNCDELYKKCLIAIHAHVFYPELMEEILQYTSNIRFRYDLYISTDNVDKENKIMNYIKNSKSCTARKTFVQVYPNKGRDIVPLIFQMKKNINKYRYICHIHTKKSLHATFGDVWREYLYKNLLGSKMVVDEIMCMFENNPKIGLIFPQNIDIIQGAVQWGSNRELAKELMNKMGLSDNLPEDDIIFPAGNMFWAKFDAVKQIFTNDYSDSDFPDENDQTDGTIMHAIERLWLYLVKENGFEYRITRYLGDNRPLDI